MDGYRSTAATATWHANAACAGLADTFDDEINAADALTVCADCPVLLSCRDWALATAVAGVAGGMTEAERRRWRSTRHLTEPVASVEDFLSPDIVSADAGPTGGRRHGLARRPAILDAVASWTAHGDSARQIGERLGVTSRTVVRLRGACRERDVA